MTRQPELIRAIQRLSACREPSGVMTVLREAARSLSGADGVTVVLRDGDLCHYVDEDAIAPLWKGRRFPMRSCISGWCMLNRRQVVIEDIYADPRIPHDAYRPTFVKSLAMVPIRSEDPIGAIGAYWAEPHRATEEEIQVLQALGDSASVALDNVQLIERLKETNRRRDEFLSMLAHELRNPLAPIRNALHVLRIRAGEGDGIEWPWKLVERQVQHLTRIVDDLLDVARLTRGRVVLRRERLDLVRLVRQCAEDRRGLLEAAGLRLSLELPETPVWVMGDATRLTQVVGSLLDNAAKFVPAGGQVAVGLGPEAGTSQAVLSVRDTGMGIEPEMLPHLFEVFTQGDRSLDRSQGGLGLGLAVARGLVELHDGSIEAASEGQGRGAEFTIRLPCEPEPPALKHGSPSAEPAAKGLRILVVEDNRDAAESLRLMLELCGHEVTLAHSGPEGVEAATAHRPDIVLCDIGLPGMDGFAVASTLRRNPETAGTRLIAVTGYGRDADRRQALDAGFDAHLVKPVAPEELLGKLVARVA